MRRKTMILAAATTVLLAGSAGTAVAAQRPPDAGAMSAECATQLDSMRARATAGQSAGVCVTRLPATKAQLDKLRNASPAGADANGPFCTTSLGAQWRVTRFVACRVMFLMVDIRLLRSGQLVGQMGFYEKLKVYSDLSDYWTFSVDLERDRAWGDYQGMALDGWFDCASCVPDDVRFTNGPVLQGGPLGGSATYRSILTGPNQDHLAAATITYQFTKPGTIPANRLSTTTPEVRCDSRIGNRDWGCVLNGVAPVFSIDGYSFDDVADHIRAAWASGIPKNVPLHRTTDEAQRNENRRVACGGREGSGDWQCDEFPFASTMEGAALHRDSGRTFPGCGIWDLPDGYDAVNNPDGVRGVGWSACIVPRWDNEGVGYDLGNFYSDQRVLHGEQFYVEII